MNIEIANRLVEMRKEKGLSQEALAAELGISRQAVSKWERAESSPDTSNLITLAKLYQMSLDDLLNTDQAKFEGAEPLEQGTLKSTSATDETSEDDEDFVKIGFRGIHVKDEDSEVKVGWRGIHVKDPNGEVKIGLGSTIEIDGESVGPWTIATGAVSIAVVILYLILGFVFHLWHPGWLVFLVIPVYAVFAQMIEGNLSLHLGGLVGMVSLIATGIYLGVGFVFNLWHPTWIVFLVIPLVAVLVDVFDHSKKDHPIKEDDDVKDHPIEDVEV